MRWREWAQWAGGWLGPWVDPKSRRPLVLLVVIAFGVFLAPLGLEVARALFFGLPRWFRWSLGEGAALGIVGFGLRRLWRVKASDAWPARGTIEPAKGAGRWLPWALRLAVASLAIPMLSNPDGLGFADWDFYLEKFEASRRTMVEWRQFPWWNPWCRGGFPLAADPQAGVVSIATPLVLALGTTAGLALTTVVFVMIAVEGAYRLARLWLGDPWAATAAALIYGLNGGLVLNVAWGYFIPMTYCVLPWLALHALRIGDRFVDGLGLGFWMGFGVLSGVHYLSIYGGLLATLIWLRAFRVQPKGGRGRLLLHTMAALGVFLALSGWRVVTVVPVLLDDVREHNSSWDLSPLEVLHDLLARPIADWSTAIPVRHIAHYVETIAYVGPLALVLALGSLWRGWRWWHTLTAFCGWLAIGSIRWYHLSYWVADWPLIDSTHIVTRWRFVALLGLGLAAGDLVAHWRRSGARLARVGAIAAVALIASDYLVIAHRQLPLSFGVPADPELFPEPKVPSIVNLFEGNGYPCVQQGYGLIQGYQPMLSYFRNAPTLRKARGEADYQGEAWTDAGPIEPTSWSPNRIVFQVEPRQIVHINQNPGSWWLVNGRRAFPELRCADLAVPFAVPADARGRLELRVRPPGLGLAVGLHVGGLALALAAWGVTRRLGAIDPGS